MNWHKFFTCCSIPFILTLLLPGQSYHTWLILEPYVHGEVVTVIEEKLPDIVHQLGFNICVRQTNFTTILDAWTKTPSVTELLAHRDGVCGFVSCKSLVVRKYFFNGYICFVIEHKNRNVTFDRLSILARYGDKAIMEFWINVSAIPSDRYAVFLGDFEQPAIKYFEHDVLRLRHLSGKSFTMNTHNETTIMLPGYQGHCVDYSKLTCRDSWNCTIHCVHNLINSTENVTLPAETIYEPLNSTLLDVRGASRENRLKINNAYRQCREAFPPRPCISQTIYTHFHEDTLDVPEGQVLFTLEFPTIPDKITSHVARVSVVELGTQIISSFGFWFSLGVLDLLPVNLYEYFASSANRQKILEFFQVIAIIIHFILSCLRYVFLDCPMRCLVKLIIWCQGASEPPQVNANPDAVVPFENDPQPFAIA